MTAWNRSTEPRPRCEVCRKAVFQTWIEARRAAVGFMRERPGTRGITPYYSRPCRCFHVGTATDHRIRKMRGKG